MVLNRCDINRFFFIVHLGNIVLNYGSIPDMMALCIRPVDYQCTKGGIL